MYCTIVEAGEGGDGQRTGHQMFQCRSNTCMNWVFKRMGWKTYRGGGQAPLYSSCAQPTVQYFENVQLCIYNCTLMSRTAHQSTYDSKVSLCVFLHGFRFHLTPIVSFHHMMPACLGAPVCAHTNTCTPSLGHWNMIAFHSAWGHRGDGDYVQLLVVIVGPAAALFWLLM